MDELIQALGDEVEDAEEESFLLFSQQIPSQNLGFIDPKAHTLDLALCGKDVTIRQSPNLLSSNRKEGTTGAVLWKITPLFAAWISSPRNLFARCGVLSQDARALELGCGISGLVSLALAPHVAKYVNTDQEYVLKYVKENVEGNYSMFRPAAKAAMKKGGKKQQTPATTKEDTIGNIMIKPLDWETSSLLALYKDLDISHLDLLISCDCIYNEALIDPLITTMRDICQLAQSKDKPTVCIVAQQLRSPDVLETWLRRFCESFRVWRVPDKELDEGLREGSGYIVHAGLLKEELQV